MESFSSTDHSKLDYDQAWFSQEWKTEATTYDRLGRPDKTSWRMARKMRPDHEEILLDGTAQSARNEETLRDRSGRPGNINSQDVVNTADLTLKQMFDISAKLVAEQDEISGLETIGWEKHSWKYLSLIDDERIVNLQRAKVYVFSDSVLCLGKIHQHPDANEAWKKRIEWIITDKSYRDFDGINGEPTEFEWNIFTGFDTLQLLVMSKIYWAD